jgi:molybdate-binding protein
VGASSTRALEALEKRRTHVAGVHLVDARTGEANVADVRRHTGPGPVVLITLARWEAGLVTAHGNPKRIYRTEHLGRRGVRLVTREEGSGARRLLERELKNAGISREAASAAQVEAGGHLEVAHAVSIGAADVGVATRDAAISFGLDFVPLAEERYDLTVPLSGFEDRRLQRLFDVLASAEFRRELSSLGYDPASSGNRIAEVGAA